MNNHGILILGHGTPSEEGTRSFLEFVKLVEALAGETPVEAGFMEFASPTILKGLEKLADLNLSQVTAVPVFLSGAGHTTNDIQPAIEEMKIKFPKMQIRLASHVGSHPKVAELSALRYKEAIAGRAEISAEETLAAIAAHGSPEPEAFEELERFAAARRKLTPGVRIVPCFSQLGVPLLKELLPTLVMPDFRRIVVQPHFLLKGRLVDAMVDTVGKEAGRHPELEFIVTEPLGCHRLLAEAVLELGVGK